MNKRVFSMVLAIMLIFSVVPAFTADSTDAAAVTEAGFGTPEIDGKIDDVWESTPYNIIGYNMYAEENFYSGWFKILWDQSNMYVLAKIYGTHFNDSDQSPWNNDSFEVFVDENNDKTKTYGEDDYQLRSDFKGAVSGQNYNLDNMKAAAEQSDNFYIVEMAFPFKTIKGEEDKTLGFNVQVNISKTIAQDRTMYGWNLKARYGSPSANTSVFGEVMLKRSAKTSAFNEPEYVRPTVGGYDEVDTPVSYRTENGITTKFDDNTYSYPVVLADEEPMLALQDLAEAIGGAAEENTLVKDNVRITYQADDRLAGYNDGHLMLERAPKVIDERLYVPVSSVVPTLGYHMEYWRFDSPPVLEISTGTNYPEPEVTLYAKDFGAVGDGVNDDKEAVVKAINAAMMTGKPTRLEFEKGAVYRLSERMDRNAYITMSNVNNVELEGNGCTFIVEKPTTMFIELNSCTNVKIKNIKATWEEHTSTQGRIISVDKEHLKFTVRLDEGFPNIATEEWRKNIGFNSFYFGMLYHPTEDRIKITEFDTVNVDDITQTGDRLYEISIPLSRKNAIDCYEVNDRIVIPTRGSGYDTPSSRFYNSCIKIQSSKDIVMDGVTITGASQLGVSVGLCTGRIVFKNYSMETKPGALFASNSDGIHYWRNRGGLVLENSKLMANLDDHVNTKGEDSCIIEKRDSRTLVVQEEWIYKVGDEIVFYDTDTKHIVGRAFLKEYKREGGNAVLTLDRDLDLSLLRGIASDKATNPTRVYDLNVVGEGTIIRNTDFLSSRRHAYIGRSQNSIFEGNRVINCGGSAIAAMNEVRSGTEPCEGLFPSTFTFRDNYIEGKDGNTKGYYPVEINSFNSNMKAQSAIDGFLIENNVINVPNSKYVMLIKAVKDLYMFNNKIIYNKDLQDTTIPVIIANCEIEAIDGLKMEYGGIEDKIHTFMSIVGCKVDEANLKNITVPAEGQWKKYTIE